MCVHLSSLENTKIAEKESESDGRDRTGGRPEEQLRVAIRLGCAHFVAGELNHIFLSITNNTLEQ